MKGFVCTLLAALALTACSSGDRSHILKVYNWSLYIDEDLIGEFEDWYEEQTGEKVEVIYQTFDINETMLAKVEMGHEDYDLVCPSDYVIEKMLKKDLLLPIPQEFGNTPNYISFVSPFIQERFAHLNSFGKNANEYAVGYMWGTTGLIYNPTYVDSKEVSSWDVMKNPAYKGHLMVKDAFLDVYAVLNMGLNHDRIIAGEVDADEVTSDVSPESVQAVENYMMSFKDNISGWEADFGREEMVKQRAWMNLAWSGDAAWAIEEAKDAGVKLDWSVPEDGSVTWFDGWVIPKYARNVKAASYFVNFLCMPENAIRNMDEIGYVSVIASPEVLREMQDEDYEPLDASYFFGEGAEAVCLNPVQYPDISTVKVLGQMHDVGDQTETLLKMWSRVKGESATNWTFVLIGVTVVAAGIFFVIGNKAGKHGRKHKKRTKKH